MPIDYVNYKSDKIEVDLDGIISILKGMEFKNDFMPHLGLEDNQEINKHFLDIYYVKEYGFHVYGSGKDNLGYYVLTEDKEDDFIVEVFLGGAEIKCHHHNFINEERMILTVNFFYAESRLNPELSWAEESNEYMDDIYY